MKEACCRYVLFCKDELRYPLLVFSWNVASVDHACKGCLEISTPVRPCVKTIEICDERIALQLVSCPLWRTRCSERAPRVQMSSRTSKRLSSTSLYYHAHNSNQRLTPIAYTTPHLASSLRIFLKWVRKAHLEVQLVCIIHHRALVDALNFAHNAKTSVLNSFAILVSHFVCNLSNRAREPPPITSTSTSDGSSKCFQY